MAFKEATDCCPGSAAVYGAPDLKKVMEWLNGSAISCCEPVLPRDTIFTISDATDITALIRFNATSITTCTTRVVTVPDSNVTLVSTTTGLICNANVGACAAIALSKLATDPLARANHTGTQLAATISDFCSTVTCNAAVVANTAKVTKATHAGEVTGATCLTIANNVIGLAELAGGTDGNLFTFDACGDPAFVATGNCGQVLTSAGVGAAPSFMCAGAGDNLGNHTATMCLDLAGNDIDNIGGAVGANVGAARFAR